MLSYDKGGDKMISYEKLVKKLNCQPGDILECVEDIEGYSDTSERKYRG